METQMMCALANLLSHILRAVANLKYTHVLCKFFKLHNIIIME